MKFIKFIFSIFCLCFLTVGLEAQELPLFLRFERVSKTDYGIKGFDAKNDRIRHIFVSPDKKKIACFLEDTNYIVALDFSDALRVFPFYIPVEKSTRSGNTLSFISIKWNKDRTKRFIAVLNFKGEKIYKGSLDEPNMIKKIKMTFEDPKGDNYNYVYIGNEIFYISDKRSAICSYPGNRRGSRPGLPNKWILTGFDISTNNQKVYYTAWNPADNKDKLYGGRRLRYLSHGNLMVEGNNQQFYPQISPDGGFVGFIGMSNKYRSFYHCVLPTNRSGNIPVRSRRKYILEQNARLREYDHMHFWNSDVYFFHANRYHHESLHHHSFDKAGLFRMNARNGEEFLVSLSQLAEAVCRNYINIKIHESTQRAILETPRRIGHYETVLIFDAIPLNIQGRKRYGLLVKAKISEGPASLIENIEKDFYGLLIVDAGNFNEEEIQNEND